MLGLQSLNDRLARLIDEDTFSLEQTKGNYAAPSTSEVRCNTLSPCVSLLRNQSFHTCMKLLAHHLTRLLLISSSIGDAINVEAA